MQRITLKSAIETLKASPGTKVAIATRARGYGIIVGGNVIRSQREDELTFLTYDGAINYVQRHLLPHSSEPLTIVICLQHDGH